jgi:hypothetical protein
MSQNRAAVRLFTGIDSPEPGLAGFRNSDFTRRTFVVFCRLFFESLAAMRPLG